METFLLISAIQGFIMSVVLLSFYFKNKNTANFFLSILIIIVSIFLHISSFGRYFVQYPKLFLTSYALIPLIIPVYYFFICYFFDSDYKIQRKNLLYFIPCVFYLVVIAKFYFMSNEEIIESLKIENPKWPAIADLLSISVAFYLLNVIRLILKKQKKYVDKEVKNIIRIFHVFNFGFVLLNLSWLLTSLMILLLSELEISTFVSETVFIVICFIVYLLNLLLIIYGNRIKEKLPKINTYNKVKIKPSEIEKITVKVKEALFLEKLYLDKELTLSKLANTIDTEKYKLSYIINREMKTSFYKLLNEQRVEEFISMYGSNQFEHYSITGIAKEAGFRSKSTFYKAFKEVKGKNPKDFFSYIN